MKPLSVFILLQMLDLLTTRMALGMGAGEQNPLVSQIMSVAPAYGLFISKLVVVGIAVLGVWMEKSKGIRVANLAFAGVVAWNLTIIFRLSVPA
jgi:uncharacterized protein DUF5658